MLRKPGIQLYTLRKLVAADLPATLQAVSSMGYREVEFAGYFGHTPTQIRRILKDAGLESPAAHVPIDRFRHDTQQVIDEAIEAGHRYLVIPWLAVEERQTLDQYRAHAALFADAGEQCLKAGIQLVYHNHDFEFFEIDGVIPYEFLLDSVDTDVLKMELDLYWIIKAGFDPLDYFSRYPGRFPLCHVKDMDEQGRMADVGKGLIDFARIFEQASTAGMHHYFVERDDAPAPLENARVSLQGFIKY